jgi:hypothetical protein
MCSAPCFGVPMTALLPALLLAALFSMPAASVARAPVSAAQAHEIVAEGSARNQARAQRSAERRLRSIELPPGAETSPARPTGVGELLREAAAIPGGRPHMTTHRFWTVPRPAHGVLAWLRRHAPPLTKQVGEIGGTSGRSLELETLPGAGGTAGLLFITVVPRSTGGSAVRADAFEEWEIPRSPLERIPAGSRFLRLSVSPGSEGFDPAGEVGPPMRTIAIEDRSLVAKLVRIVNRQPAFQLVGPVSCGPVPGPGWEFHLTTLVFKTSRHGRVLAQISQKTPIGICDPLQLQVGGRRSYALEGGWNVLRAVRGSFAAR